MLNEKLKVFSFLLTLICFISKCKAQSPQTIANITISFVNDGTHTTFLLTSSLDGTFSDRWIGLGFNSFPQMVFYLFFCIKNKIKIVYLFISQKRIPLM